MAYYTTFLLTIENESPEIWEAIRNDREMYYSLGEDGQSGDSNSWYSHETDMERLSLEFPDAIFHLKGTGEQAGDIWEKDFKDGKKQIRKAVITIPDYDPDWKSYS